jgi:hypothetical protein
MRILIVEDQVEISKILKKNLEAECLSLRIILWICVMTIWLISERKNWRKLVSKFNYWLPLSVLGLTIIVALIHGLALSNDSSLIFTELKRWVYLFTLVPILVKTIAFPHDIA